MTRTAELGSTPGLGDEADLEAAVRTVLASDARLSVDPFELKAADDLYAAGMTSHASVNVMLAIELRFDIEFPEPMLKRSTFASVASISAAVREIRSRA